MEDERERAETERKAQAELAAARGADVAEAQTHLEEVASRNQIFNVREAFAMLSRELSDMMRDTVWPSHTHTHTLCLLPLVCRCAGFHLRALG